MPKMRIQGIIRAKFEVVRKFEKLIEQQLSSEFEVLGEQRDEVLGNLRSEEDVVLDEIMVRLFPDYLSLEFVFPNIFRKSIFLITFSMFEDSIQRLCRVIEKTSSSPVKLNDMRGNGIVRSHLFLERITGMLLEDSDNHWEDINKLRLLRNCLAHGGGEILERHKKLRQFVESNSALNIDDQGYVVFSREFNKWARTRLETYLMLVGQIAEPNNTV